MRRFQNLPLERKLAAIVVVTTVAGMLLAGLAVTTYQVFTFARFMISELETTADILADNGAAALRFEVPRDAERTLASLRAKMHISGACFFNTREEVFAVYARQTDAPPHPTLPLEEGYTFARNRLVWVKRIHHDGDFIGLVHIESDLDLLYAQITRSLAATLLIIAACSSLALLLAFRYLRTISEPIKELIDTANQISQRRDYSLRAAKYAEDDLGTLTEEFNDMLQEIQWRDSELQQEIHERRRAEDALQKAYGELEERIQERTAQLSLTNERLQASLEEKVVLLKEIHHRVKNNLQVVSSLLSLQTRHIQDPGELEMFVNSQNRVRSMALIHEKLYQSDDLARVDFARYIPSLVDNLFATYKTSTQHIALRIEVVDVLLELEQAIPCGLMINELVSNALKYAFPDDRQGEIYVYLGPEEESAIRLVVRDDGVGFPLDIDFRTSKSLGLELINILVRQLHGDIEKRGEKGTEFRIRFPRKTPKREAVYSI